MPFTATVSVCFLPSTFVRCASPTEKRTVVSVAPHCDVPVFAPASCTPTCTCECAGHAACGRKCTSLVFTQCHEPTSGVVVATVSRCSTAALSCTGLSKRMTIGALTPTVQPLNGVTV